MESYFARMKGGVVDSIIVVNENTNLPTFSIGFDSFITADRKVGGPGPTWKYDGSKFTKPVAEEVIQQEEL